MRDHFVCVPVRRGAGSSLKNIHDELIIQFFFRHFPRRRLNRHREVLIENSEFGIGDGRVLFDQTGCANKASRETEIADGEILHGPGGLGAIVSVCRNTHFPHGIRLSAKLIVLLKKCSNPIRDLSNGFFKYFPMEQRHL